MAYLQDDEKSKNGQSGSGGAYIGGGSGQGSTTNVAKDGNAPSSSGNYTNLMNYLSANEGNAGTMGQAAADTVSKTGNEFDKGLTDWSGAASKAIDAGTAKTDDNMLKDVRTGMKDAPGAATYSGPATYNDVSGAPDQSKLNDLETQTGWATKGVEGAGNLLGQTYGGSHYSGGENTLDAYVTANNQAGQQALKGINDKWGGERAKYEGIKSQIGSDIDTAKKTTEATNSAYAKAGQEGKIQRDIQQTMLDRSAGNGWKWGNKENLHVDDKLYDGSIPGQLQTGSSPGPSVPLGNPFGDSIYSATQRPGDSVQMAHGGRVEDPKKRYQGIHSMISR